MMQNNNSLERRFSPIRFVDRNLKTRCVSAASISSRFNKNNRTGELSSYTIVAYGD